MRTLSTLIQLRDLCLRLFAIGATLLIAVAVTLLVWSARPTFATVLLVALAVVALIAIALGLFAFYQANQWNRLRKQGWSSMTVRVVPDHAQEEVSKTLLDTLDGSWRLAVIGYPLEARDAIAESGTMEYVGAIAHDKPILIRPVDQLTARFEYFCYAKSRASLEAGRS